MPELPEVETVVRSLEPIKNQTIIDANVYQYQLRVGSKIPANFCDDIKGTTITNIVRIAKYIVINLSNQKTIIVHLGMSGNLLLKEQNFTPEKHTHVLINLTNHTLIYNDPRRFGLVDLIDTNSISDYFAKKSMGVDALADEFCPSYLKTKLQGRKTPIKIALLNQEVVAGLGNIYVCEALFMAKIHPSTPASSLKKKDLEKLVPIIKQVLQKSIQAGGTTLKDYKSSDGTPGYFVQELLVYGKENLPCPTCKHPIEKIILGGRSTFFCSKCQK